jgi:hypothetical protein
VVCEAGRLIKVSKDRDGVVTQDVLTKQWTDWIARDEADRSIWSVRRTTTKGPVSTSSP